MIKKHVFSFVVVAFIAAVFAPGELIFKTANAESTAPAQKLTVVEAQYVCMVNNTLFPKEQIPVQVDGKTYYGCCEMCKGKLNQDPSARLARDPVSGAEVDKATAVIGASADGNVVYFENLENLNKFVP